jgi:beta-galactosidase
VTPTTGGLQYQQASQEVAALRKLRQPDAKMPAAYAARKAAILYEYENRWDLDNHKQNVAWDTYGHLQKYYSALKRVGAPVDVITEEKDFAQYPFLIVPAAQLVDDGLVARWRQYAENGGHLVLTCRTGQKDRRGFLWEGPWGKPILELIGARIAGYDTLPAPVTGKVTAGGQTFEWSSWGEILAPAGTAYSGNLGVMPTPTVSSTETMVPPTVLARYADQYYNGQAAAITHKLGKGSVTYIGVDSKDGGFEAAMIRGVYERANVPVQSFEEGFVVDWRDSFWVATNFSEKKITVPAPEGAKLLVGERELGPAGVAVWQE